MPAFVSYAVSIPALRAYRRGPQGALVSAEAHFTHQRISPGVSVSATARFTHREGALVNQNLELTVGNNWACSSSGSLKMRLTCAPLAW